MFCHIKLSLSSQKFHLRRCTVLLAPEHSLIPVLLSFFFLLKSQKQCKPVHHGAGGFQQQALSHPLAQSRWNKYRDRAAFSSHSNFFFFLACTLTALRVFKKILNALITQKLKKIFWRVLFFFSKTVFYFWNMSLSKAIIPKPIKIIINFGELWIIPESIKY